MMALGIVISWACSRIEEAPQLDGSVEGTLLTVRATLADAAGTRTVLNPDKSIYWTKGDAINLFYGDRSSGEFVSSVGDEPVQTTDFVGTLTVATGSSEANMSARAFWGVYPYDENNTCDGTGVTMTLPSLQEALAGSFADKLNPSVATSAGLDLEFYNVGAPFYFSLTQEGVTSATFRGNNDEDVAGKVRISMGSDGKPVAEVLEGVKSITLTAPAGGFVPGETYVLVLLPQVQMTAGYTVTFKKGNWEADCVVSKSVPFVRSKGRDKMNADEGLSYTHSFIPDVVDLGLSVKWASFNLGATTPEEYGDYYAWGETEPKEVYNWETYKWCKGSSMYSLTKYHTAGNSQYWGGSGSPDGKTTLVSEDDAAYVKLGGGWRMPTAEEWTELIDNCTWTWTTQNGIDGRLGTASNGRSIFFPAAGYRDATGLHSTGYYSEDAYRSYYWSSSLYKGYPVDAYIMYFNSSSVYCGRGDRYYGYPIRPVTE